MRIIVPEFPLVTMACDVLFTDDVSDGVPYDILLGQEDFFRRFLVRFEKHHNKFYLDRA